MIYQTIKRVLEWVPVRSSKLILPKANARLYSFDLIKF